MKKFLLSIAALAMSFAASAQVMCSTKELV